MRRFHSYGPVDSERHFCVPRTELIQECLTSLVDHPEKGGHYFTIWAPRQSGKTWLIRQVRQDIVNQYAERFQVGMMSMQGVVLGDDDPVDAFLTRAPMLFRDAFGLHIKTPKTWEEWAELWHINTGLFDKKPILFIDEFDSLPSAVIDRLVTLFRDMYLNRESYLLHGLALIGVRAVLGMGSGRGSPFNVQRALHVPNLTRAEVGDMFAQYEQESGQAVRVEVVDGVFEQTRGQPGLVGWFGELLTEKYNPGGGSTVTAQVWNNVLHAALTLEWNSTVLNLVAKARGQYLDWVVNLFASSDTPFSIDAQWCNYLYLNGIIDADVVSDAQGQPVSVCRFSSPFVQTRLFNALTDHFAGKRTPILSLDPLDRLTDVLDGEELDLTALLGRYRDYLARLEERGINPWLDQPRRGDLHLTEAVGHFHLYAWMKEALADICIVAPEFPTGNGKVDLHLRCGTKEGIIEVKSFRGQAQLTRGIQQAGRYAHSLGSASVCMALFAPVRDQKVLAQLSGTHHVEGVRVDVAAIGWG